MVKAHTSRDLTVCGDESVNRHEASSPRHLTYDALVGLADEALMEYLVHGHHDALAVLFDRYHRLVMNIALRILRDVGEAEELAQSVFLEILRSAAQFDPAKGTTKVWVLQYAYHRSFNRRQYLSLRGFYGNSPEFTCVLTDATAGHTLDRLESTQAVQKALGKLKKNQRKVLELSFYEGLTMHEIAEATQETFDAVRHHYYRGLEKLRLILCESPRARAKTSVQRDVAHV